MPHNLNLRIGGIGIRLFADFQEKYAQADRFVDFASTILPQAVYQVYYQPIPAQPTTPPVFKSRHVWGLYQQGDRWIIWSRLRQQNPYMAGLFSPDFHSGDIFVSESHDEPGSYVYPLARPMGELLMVNLLGTGYGIMLHACGVVDRGQGFIFAGVSGNGKTTTARLWDGLPGVRILNDDHLIVRKIDGQFWIFGTPWYGVDGTALAEEAPLKQIFILKHAPENRAIRLSPAWAAAALLVRTFAPLWNARAMAITLEYLKDLTTVLPVYELGFLPDRTVVDYVRSLPNLPVDF